MKFGDVPLSSGLRTGKSGEASLIAEPQAEDPYDELRRKIGELIRTSGRDCYASVSALLGRSHSYIQQYLTRRSPKLLRESDRRKIARYFNIPEWELLLPDEQSQAADSDLVMIPRWRSPLDEQAGPGEATAGPAEGHQPFLKTWLAARFSAPAAALAIMAIDGDVMAPTLCDGDQVLVDTQQSRFRSDGLYMIQAGGAVRPRRLTAHPSGDLVIISNDNPLYPGALECGASELAVVGRVLWVGRSL